MLERKSEHWATKSHITDGASAGVAMIWEWPFEHHINARNPKSTVALAPELAPRTHPNPALGDFPAVDEQDICKVS